MVKHRVVADLASEVRPCHGVAQLRHSMLSRAPWCWNLTADVLPEAPFLSFYIYICMYIESTFLTWQICLLPFEKPIIYAISFN